MRDLFKDAPLIDRDRKEKKKAQLPVRISLQICSPMRYPLSYHHSHDQDNMEMTWEAEAYPS